MLEVRPGKGEWDFTSAELAVAIATIGVLTVLVVLGVHAEGDFEDPGSSAGFGDRTNTFGIMQRAARCHPARVA